jgi:glycosyltransferase involved in cell wall biosynthesis
VKYHPDRTLRVGYYTEGYVAGRLLIDLPFGDEVHLERKRDLFNALTFAQRKLYRPPTARKLINCLHHDMGFPDVHLNHLMNSISLSSIPWVVSYEHYLPRWDWDSAWGWKYLAAPACRRIIAISQWALRFQEHLLSRHPELREAIRPKFCVMTPGQKILVARYDEKLLDPDRITFTMVGGDFFRKGGMEILEAFTQLVSEKLPVHLNIVSTLTYGDYASKTTESDLNRAQALIAGLGDRVTHYNYLDNPRVLELFTRSHVGLLPTYDDTYGFSALEAQGAGCPVISTDGAALPEFNNDAIGWLIAVPKDELNGTVYETPADRQRLSTCIRDGLLRIIRQICADPSVVRTKGERALERIRLDCSPGDRVRQLKMIYHESLAAE